MHIHKYTPVYASVQTYPAQRKRERDECLANNVMPLASPMLTHRRPVLVDHVIEDQVTPVLYQPTDLRGSRNISDGEKERA